MTWTGFAGGGRGCPLPKTRRHETAGRDARPPERIAGAVWQAGVTPDSDQFKVLFNGEPRADIVAAGDDWIELLRPLEETETKVGPHAPLGRDYLADPLISPRRLSGHVQIVRADGSALSRLERKILGIRN